MTPERAFAKLPARLRAAQSGRGAHTIWQLLEHTHLARMIDFPREDVSVLERGALLLHYRIVGKLGQGGMGEVYQAEDTKLGRSVAIKLLPERGSADPKARQRLLQEARSASALNHPNIVTVHSIEECDGRDFIVMEHLEGEDLRSRLKRGPLGVPELAQWGAETAEALAAAHSKGILHRDVKSANILINREGRAKVLDFGLAKALIQPPADGVSQEPTLSKGLTDTGLIVGTVAYMSPEQTRGEPLDARSDIFSLGTVLYEAATGELPFAGPSALSLMHEIAVRDPPAPSTVRPNLPPGLNAIIRRAMAKPRESRFESAAEMAQALRAIAAPGSGAQVAVSRSVAVSRPVLIAIALTLVAAAATFAYRRQADVRWARSALPRLSELAESGKSFEAYDLALRIRRHLPRDPTLIRLQPSISTELSVTTDPPGARVSLKRYAPDGSSGAPAKVLVGVTPLQQLPIARGSYILSIEKEGYATVERTLSGAAVRQGGAVLFPPPIQIQRKLTEASKVPPGMVAVPAGDYRLVGWNRPSTERVRLGAYHIDRFEVSNRDFKEFVLAGGYLKERFWPHPVVDAGQTIPGRDAVRRFTDRTGLPGPRSWTNQEFPEGRAQHPVTDVTWHEAAAYCAFRDKRLPNVFQWEKAAREGASPIPIFVTMPWGLLDESVSGRANFKGSGSLPVDALEFGMSPHGCYNMAGNVAEWCQNPKGPGFTTAGGSWEDPVYLFGQYGAFPGTYSSNTLGFRCVLNAEDSPGGDMALPDQEPAPVFEVSSPASFRSWAERYRYETTPSAAQVGEIQETPAWRRETVTFAGAGGERVPAYLYLPRNVAPPFHVIHVVPGGDVWGRLRPLSESIEARAAPFIKSGRAVFAVVSRGFIGREWPADRVRPDSSSPEYLEEVVATITEMRRGLDYLETRTDIDTRRLAYLANSVGGFKLVVPAVERRYRSVVLAAAGVDRSELERLPETAGFRFAPHINGPTLLVHGRYDEDTPLKTRAEPLFRLLPEPKKLELFDGGHVPPLEVLVPLVNRWFDETLGPVAR